MPINTIPGEKLIVDKEIVSHRCESNDNYIHFLLDEDGVDEIFIGTSPEVEGLVIGFEDLKAALHKIGLEIIKKNN